LKISTCLHKIFLRWIILGLESPSGKCADLTHSVAASNNRDQPMRSLCYCLFAIYIYIYMYIFPKFIPEISRQTNEVLE